MLETIIIAAWIGFLIGSFVGMAMAGASYRNGVTDGYGYAKEPENPGYQAAGDWLKANMHHRWPELRDEWPENYFL